MSNCNKKKCPEKPKSSENFASVDTKLRPRYFSTKYFAPIYDESPIYIYRNSLVN